MALLTDKELLLDKEYWSKNFQDATINQYFEIEKNSGENM